MKAQVSSSDSPLDYNQYIYIPDALRIKVGYDHHKQLGR